jgi:hypothetical protein
MSSFAKRAAALNFTVVAMGAAVAMWVHSIEKRGYPPRRTASPSSVVTVFK